MLSSLMLRTTWLTAFATSTTVTELSGSLVKASYGPHDLTVLYLPGDGDSESAGLLDMLNTYNDAGPPGLVQIGGLNDMSEFNHGC